MSSDLGKTSHFRSILKNALAKLTQSGFVQQNVPAPFSQQISPHGVTLQSYGMIHPHGTEMKCAYLISPRMEIMTLMIYPKNAETIPIFASEYLALPEKILVAILDLQPAVSSDDLWKKIDHALSPLQKTLQDKLTPGGELPAWAHDYFSPNCIYARPKSAEETPILRQAFQDYLEIWLKHFRTQETGVSVRLDALRNYQQHHITHMPGRPFLTKTFGEPWTEAYFRSFLYTSQRE